MDEPILYLLVRNELESMNPGKAIAQGSHAATMFGLRAAKILADRNSGVIGMALALEEWLANRDFGTTITLEAPMRAIHDLIATVSALPLNDAISGIVHDPTYPLRDGTFTHLIPLDTCGYLFGRRSIVSPLVSHYPLYK